ncbi:MAG: EAL domain-containing protein [Lachnospiraceae bacterium]|nr:EAL domain-containing protein [Lachnospiraceae bacterium]
MSKRGTAKAKAPSVSDHYNDILSTDALTGILNRRGFYVATEELIRENTDTDYVICCINIDKFKLVNDLFGIKAGDELLVFLASRLKRYVREKGTYGRLTADNFAICIPDEKNVYKRVTASLEKWLDTYPISINIITRCGFYHIHDRSVEVGIMCDRANLAIQEIKGSYEKSYAVYDDTLRKRILQEQEILNEMKNALDSGQFAVYYQPKFNMENGKLIGSEALVRWIHPEKGLISPGIFVPIFEKNGFISSLDQYVWETVCRDIRQWLDEGYTVCPVSINVSRAELYNKDLSNFLVKLVNKYKVPQEFVQLEITESAYTDDPDQIIRMVRDLKSRGFVILMDDFGSGYSSLNTLKDVPVDVLKLDLKFLYNMDHNLKANYILKSVVQMAMRLDLIVIAEGVETETQAEFLKSIGCIRAQGYLYAKPMPKKDLEMFLSDPDRVSQTDEDAREAIVNIDDVLAGFHREDELEWYRAAVIQLKAMLYEYDIENDIMLIFDMQMEDESRELQRMEIASYLSALENGDFMYEDDSPQVLDMIKRRDIEPLDIRLKAFGASSRGYRWYRRDGRVLTTSDGTPKSIVGVLRDVSDEKAEMAMLEVVSTFENEKDERMLMERVLAAITYGLAASSTGIIFTRGRRSTDLGGVVLDINGDREVIYDAEVITALDEEISKLEINDQGISVLNVDDFYSFGPAIQEVFFSKGARIVAVYRVVLSEKLTMVVFTTYKAAGKRFTPDDMRHLSEVYRSVRNSYDRLYSDRFEKEDTEMYYHAFSKSGTRLWEWDINSHILHRTGNAQDDDGMGEWVENVPDVYVENGMIHPDFVDDYLRVYRNLESGKDDTIMMKKRQLDGSYVWVHIGYSVITDVNGDPVKAIGIGEDVDQLYQSQMHVREMIMRKTFTKDHDKRGWFKVDLEADTVLEAEGDLIVVESGKSYHSYVDRFCEESVVPEDREKFLRNNLPDDLLDYYMHGTRVVASSYRYKRPDGRISRRFLSIDIDRDKENRLCAYIRHRSMDCAHQSEKYAVSAIRWNEKMGMYEEKSFTEIARGIMNNEKHLRGALYIIDMDKSNLIRETLGEKYASELVFNIASIIKAIMPDNAIYGRLLDDRFAVFIPEIESHRECFIIYRDIQKSVYNAFTINKIHYVLSCSMGLGFTEEYVGDYDGLYSATLDEMYSAKSIETSI